MTDEIQDFDQLAASRRAWIEDVLRPWCQQATRKDLLKAEQEWLDIAGNAAPEQTLWTWAWERFPTLVYDGLTGVNETQQVQIELINGESHSGFPEGRRSKRGELFLLLAGDMETASANDLAEAGPFSLDDIAAVNPIGS
jgi:hypothetical protein